jgi:hypothetical protein
VGKFVLIVGIYKVLRLFSFSGDLSKSYTQIIHWVAHMLLYGVECNNFKVIY